MEDFFSDLNTIPRGLLLITGFIPLILKLRIHFSRSREKQSVKQDLEILELAKKTGLPCGVLEESLKEKLLKEENTESKIFGFLTGFFVFIFFGFWSISIYENNNGFSAWMGVTIFMCLVGISLLFDNNSKNSNRDVFLKIELKNRANFQFGLIMFLFTLIVGVLIIVRDQEINFWVVLNFMFFLISISAIFKCISVSRK